MLGSRPPKYGKMEWVWKKRRFSGMVWPGREREKQTEKAGGVKEIDSIKICILYNRSMRDGDREGGRARAMYGDKE